MRELTIVVGLLAAVAFAGCKKKDDGAVPPPAPAAEERAAGEPRPGGHGSGTGGGGGGGMGDGSGGGRGGTGRRSSKMANCPSAVPGAITTVAETKDAVEITVLGKDAPATDEIRARGKRLAQVAQAPEAGQVKHTGTGTGGGEVGFCPVVLDDTSVAYAEVEGGARLTVTPSRPDGLAALAAEAKRRNDSLPKP